MFEFTAAEEKSLQQQETENLKEEKEMTIEQGKENLKEELLPVVNALSAAAEVIKETPELKENLSFLLKEYAEVFKPFFDTLNGSAIEMRMEAFKRFKELNMSDELAVKLVCGR